MNESTNLIYEFKFDHLIRVTRNLYISYFLMFVLLYVNLFEFFSGFDVYFYDAIRHEKRHWGVFLTYGIRRVA